MSSNIEREHPNGAVQGICSGAIGLLALLIAFIGYAAYNSKAANIPWSYNDLNYLIPAFIASIALAIVPWLATAPQPKDSVGISVERARLSFLIGALCVILSIAISIFTNFRSSI
jgi:hypothetical protein